MVEQLICSKKCSRWDVFEVSIQGPDSGNPFTEQWIKGVFQGAQETICCDGFYDGDGIYRVRFMPSYEGEYYFSIDTSFGKTGEGSFMVLPAKEGNHGPVRVVNTYHMKYDDGTVYYSIGTTCYVWELQKDALIAQTLETLEHTAFNKIRFCIFPKHYDFNTGEPRSYPYEGTPMDSSVVTEFNFFDYTGKKEGNNWDFTRFNPQHFQHIENCIKWLGERGIEADLILMHPYDRWGFSDMGEEADDRYIRYVTARFAAFHNVWWSLANEYDLMPQKSEEDWERIAGIVCEKDPYHHMRSIHNCAKHYDYTKAWITHCSLQRLDLYKSSEEVSRWRKEYGKPVVMDEIAYEGDIPHGWGNITAEEMVRRFWEAAVRGGYPGHGETYLTKDRILWWSHGGVLHGESHKRFQFLLDTLNETPGIGLKQCPQFWDEICAVPEEGEGNYYLFYYSFMRPSYRDFFFDENSQWQVQVLDTWNMTREMRGIYKGHFRIELPARQYMAIQLKKI